jgi:hypothetical protein
MSVFEIGMLVCFGISWPISIAKALRTKRVVGKSPVFMAIICLGYLSGMLHKVFFALDWVILLYFVNFCMVAFDLFLYFYYLPKESSRGEYAISNCR